MDRTFPLRRQTILEQPMNIESIFENFPFLQESEQVTSNYLVEILNFSFHVAYERNGKDYR